MQKNGVLIPKLVPYNFCSGMTFKILWRRSTCNFSGYPQLQFQNFCSDNFLDIKFQVLVVNTYKEKRPLATMHRSDIRISFLVIHHNFRNFRPDSDLACWLLCFWKSGRFIKKRNFSGLFKIIYSKIITVATDLRDSSKNTPNMFLFKFLSDINIKISLVYVSC